MVTACFPTFLDERRAQYRDDLEEAQRALDRLRAAGVAALYYYEDQIRALSAYLDRLAELRGSGRQSPHRQWCEQ